VIDDPSAQRWYRQAVIYCVDVDSFADASGDGWGDFRGLRLRLPHLARLGVTCLWLNPIHPTPHRDDGYDVSDYYAVDPRLGTLGDFVELVHEAADHGIRIVIDLVVNHTSDQHPWFVAAKSDPQSPYRDFYVWSQDEPADRFQGMVFPGEQRETWSWCEEAGAWYYHRFYEFQPDLNWRNPEVRAEIQRVMGFWLQLGVAGFRVDAAPFVIELVEPGAEPDVNDFQILTDWRQYLQWHQGDSVLLGEANVSPQDVPQYFGSSEAGADRMHMLFDFVLNPRLFLALARRSAEPLAEALTDAVRVPRGGQWVTFLRNHDELDLSRLTESQRAEVFEAFAPEEDMRLYGRGIRRRLAPMLGGDRRRIELAYALQFSLPGTPALRYGEEIGMGEDLALKGRDAFRTPMQWDAGPGAGFSKADPEEFTKPLVDEGPFAYPEVNVARQRGVGDSLLTWTQRLINVRRECPENGDGTLTLVDGEGVPPEVLVHRVDGLTGSLIFLHNLCDEERTVDLTRAKGLDDVGPVQELLADAGAEPLEAPGPGKGKGKGTTGDGLGKVPLSAYGYRWIRLMQ
jgi:maltose alpha-D-glucosyltransferase/alpha-amylase